MSFEEGLVKECLSKGSGHVLENILLFALFHFSHLNFILFYCLIFFFHFFAAVTQAPKPKPKPGTCPFYPIRIRCAVTTNACLTDNECPGNLKCCYDNCRSICTLPDYGMNKNIHSLSLLR